jgi:hypothetical protein
MDPLVLVMYGYVPEYVFRGGTKYLATEKMFGIIKASVRDMNANSRLGIGIPGQ